MRYILISTFFLSSVLIFSASVLAEENAPIARIEHRPVQHPNFQHGQTNHSRMQQYHPAARDEAHQDVNRAAETNALNSAGSYGGIPQAVPVYPSGLPPTSATPTNTTNSGNSVNVYTVPQGTTPSPQH